ncbi:NAD(P)-dependent oxidoreductase [Streptomyces sp. NPDC008137]|uniref:NAD(P)-dependent oxidoreductase n=1 Tax=Streptomyces sp. NPDC008137 TaxID=3364813 RepID=UPI0036EAD1B8
MPNPEILITGTGLVPDSTVEYVTSRDYTPRRIRRDDLTEDELIEALDGAFGYLIGGNETPTDKVFESSTRLRAVAFVGTDYRLYVPGWRRARSLGMSVVSTPGANTQSVAEFTILLMLTQSRSFASVAASAEQPDSAPPPVGRTVAGKRLGIIGLGRIGKEVARIARLGLGMEVCYAAPRRATDADAELGIRHCAKSDLLRWSDVVSLHRPGPAPQEEPELTAREFALMRPGTLLVNTVHPDLVDPPALLAAVADRGLRCAFDGRGSGPEWEALTKFGPDRFLAAPLMAYNTTDANETASMAAARSVCDILDLDGRRTAEGEPAGELK